MNNDIYIYVHTHDNKNYTNNNKKSQIITKEVINKTVIEKQRNKASTELKRSLSQNDSV